jgi:thermostable 8-oxoguanine DNA glycosylase
MENYKNIKYTILAILAFIIATNNSKAQTTYQSYDQVTRGAEYHISKSQIESNKKQMQYLNQQKRSLSLTQDSQTRSRIQGVISAKNDENFRLNQKAFLLMDSKRVENVDKYNQNFNRLKASLQQNK